jgi:hypothetical protein
VQTLLQKGWIETAKSGPKNVVSLSAHRRVFESKKVAYPSPTQKATVREGEVISLIATRKPVIN